MRFIDKNIQTSKTIEIIGIICLSWLFTDYVLAFLSEPYINMYIRLEGHEFFRNYILTEINISYLLHFVITYVIVIKRIYKVEFQVTVFSRKTIFLVLLSTLVISVSIFEVNTYYKMYTDEIIGILIMNFLIATCEEIVYRSSILTILYQKGFCVKRRIAISVCVFVTMHFLAYVLNGRDIILSNAILSLIAPFFLGGLLTIDYELEHNITHLIIFHMCYNVLAMITNGQVKNVSCVICFLLVMGYILSLYMQRRRKNEKNCNYSNSYVLTVLPFSHSVTFAQNVEADSELEKIQCIEENLNSPMDKSVKLVDEALSTAATEKTSNLQKDMKVLGKQFENLDIADVDYNEQVLDIIEETKPEVLSAFIEQECEKLVLAIDNISDSTPTSLYTAKNDDGDTVSAEVYDLGSGTEIIVQGVDEEDDANQSFGDSLFSPCALKTATWVTNNNIHKDRGDRRYTAIYSLKASGTQLGKLTVTNHYTVNKASVKMRAAEIWETEYISPLTVETLGRGAMSSTTEIKNKGEEIYARDEFNVTCSQKTSITNETSVGADVGVTISGSTSTTVEWAKNKTRLHKLYAAVDLKSFDSTGANLKQWGKVTFAE